MLFEYVLDTAQGPNILKKYSAGAMTNAAVDKLEI